MLKLNVGCGPTGKIEGFENLDNSPAVLLHRMPWLKRWLGRLGLISGEQERADWSGVVWCDAGKRLPYPDGSVDKIYSSHFLEHLTPRRGKTFVKECHRVLTGAGVMRLVVPDLMWHAERYVRRTRRLMTADALSNDPTVHDDFMETVCGAYLNRRRIGALHANMYDFPSLAFLLKSAGFRSIDRCGFGKGTDVELASYDSRPEDSLHVEVFK